MILLSHLMSAAQPLWPGSPPLELVPFRSIDGGDSCNTHVVHVYSHHGTHVDAPYHFLRGGRKIGDLPLRAFAFERPLLLEIPLAEGELLTSDHLAAHRQRAAGHDLLILQSGFESARVDPERYARRGPGVSADAARYLRAELPDARGLALDFISLAAHSRRDQSAEAHRVLLSDEPGGRPVLIFEDVRVSALEGAQPSRVLALPWFYDALDGSPCTMVAEVD